MKKFLLICCMLLFLCSCTQGPVTEDNIPPNNSYEKDSASADAEEINITSYNNNYGLRRGSQPRLFPSQSRSC